MNLQGISMKTLEDRRLEFQKDWDRRLTYLVAEKGMQFEDVWTRVVGLLNEISSGFGLIDL